MLKMVVGQTEEIEGAIAATEVLDQCHAGLGGLDPAAGWLLAGPDLEAKAFLDQVLDVHPGLELVGCSTPAPMSSAGGYAEGATTLTLFASDVIDFTTGVGTGATTDLEQAVDTAVTQAVSGTSKPPALAIATPTVEQVNPSSLAAALARTLGDDVVVFGGGAVPDYPIDIPWLGASQFRGREILTDAVPLLLFSGPLHVSVGIRHGWANVGATATVTRSSERFVHEIDGRPALEYLDRYVGVGERGAPAAPLAVLDEASGRTYLRAPQAFDEGDGTVAVLGSVPEGAEVHLALSSPDQILEGTAQSIADAIAEFPSGHAPEAALVSSCIVRNFLLGAQSADELAIIREAAGNDVPVTGFYCYGEIGPLANGGTNFHNGTCVVALLGT